MVYQIYKLLCSQRLNACFRSLGWRNKWEKKTVVDLTIEGERRDREGDGCQVLVYTPSVVSSRARYAMRALLDLSRRHPSGPVLVNDIAVRQNIPLNFLHQILLDLKLAGLVTSRKGPGGGFVLAKAPDEISLLDILSTIEGPSLALTCQGPQQDCGCPNPETCAIRGALAEASAKLRESLGTVTLADLRAEQANLDAHRLQIIDFSI